LTTQIHSSSGSAETSLLDYKNKKRVNFKPHYCNSIENAKSAARTMAANAKSVLSEETEQLDEVFPYDPLGMRKQDNSKTINKTPAGQKRERERNKNDLKDRIKISLGQHRKPNLPEETEHLNEAPKFSNSITRSRLADIEDSRRNKEQDDYDSYEFKSFQTKDDKRIAAGGTRHTGGKYGYGGNDGSDIDDGEKSKPENKSVQNTEQPQKRGRGRPRKNPVAAPVAPVAPSQKRGRGRPRKVISEGLANLLFNRRNQE
jgi:hypothetical protein